MTIARLALTSLAFYWRTHLAVLLGVAAGAGATTGALLVGDSMRGSLRELALGRLGNVDFALQSPGFFRTALADELQDAAKGASVAPAIILSGSATHPETQARSNHATIYGVDERSWPLMNRPAPRLDGRSAVLNAALARQLGLRAGDDLLLNLSAPGDAPLDSLMGDREAPPRALRLRVSEIAPDSGAGAFSLSPRQAQPLNVYLPLDTLQRAIERRDGANTLLIQSMEPNAAAWRAALKATWKLADAALRLRVDDEHGYVSLESESTLIPPPVESAALGFAGASATPILSYLANEISLGDERAAGGIPYSIVAAIDFRSPDGANLAALAAEPAPGEALLNRWAADDLNAQVGDTISIEYYASAASGQLETRRASFTLRGILPLDGAAADPGFTPEYPGVTDSQRLSDWDPPFPVDLKRVREKDEQYWARHRTTPKMFITLDDGRRLWADSAARFGTLTSIRFRPGAGQTPAELASSVEQALRERISPDQLGLTIDPIASRLEAASQGTTDFGGLFIGFSLFLIVSAALLVALLFRLGAERRASQLGLLLACGWTRGAARRLWLSEGACVALVGSLLGLALACGYAWLMIAGLRGWWSQAANAPFLRLHVAPQSLLIGLVAGVAISLLSIAASLRGLATSSPRRLLAGLTELAEPRPLNTWITTLIAAGALLGAAGSALAGASLHGAQQAGPFFASGTLTLVSGLAVARLTLRPRRQAPLEQPGLGAILRLGVRNARRRRGRSLTTISLLASASFLIIALAAFRADPDTSGKASGGGGFNLYAESPAPLPYALDTPESRAPLDLSTQTNQALANGEVLSLRLRAGDPTSCTSLFQATRPRVLGASDALIRRGGFRFAATLNDASPDNPWRLLTHTFDDSAIPAIGDEAAVQWQLHKGLGQVLELTDERGDSVRLRFVALLAGSALQDELIVSDENFLKLFPSSQGRTFFLISAPPEQRDAAERGLEQDLAGYGFDVQSIDDRIRGYLAVQNTYLSAFQTVGAFGLGLGALGLAALSLRNVFERRQELGILRALGYRSFQLTWLVLSESAFLIGAGLLIGLAAAMVAVAPAAHQRPATLPWGSLGLTLGAVVAIGLGAGAWATRRALRAPVAAVLRAD